MIQYLILATAEGLAISTRDGQDWRVERRGLGNQRATCVSIHEDTALAGTTGGIFRSTDLGETWMESSQGLSERHVRWMAQHPESPSLAFAGTEPAGIYISLDGGATWSQRQEVGELRQKFNWYLPYSPAAGCVRGFAAHKDRIYAAVEVGGVLCSNDRGETWKLAGGSSGRPGMGSEAKGQVHPDVHSIAVHTSSTELVFAPTGGGFYRSQNGGETWELLYRCYCRAVWVDPADPGHMILGPADGVDRNGRIEETRDGGVTWKPASSGLDTPWPRHMVERFYQNGEELLAVLSNGELIATPLETLEWRRVLPEVEGVRAVASLDH